jgi:hypothetical protein
MAMQFSAFGFVITCPAAEPKRDAAFWQKVLDHAHWSWSDREAEIFYSMTQSGFAYQIELIRPPGGSDELTIRFVKDGKAICSWKGHTHSVFVQKDSTLVYALFHPSQQGCTLVAVNLDSGAELWRTELQAIEKAGHSGYSNLINMNAAEGIVVVHGKEGFGNYDEIVDLKTGKTLAHRVYDKEPKENDK